MIRVIALVGSGRGLEAALRLGEVTALALTPPDAELGLVRARAAGAARAVALWDESLRDTDYYGGSQALASAVRHLGFDLVVCSDGDRGLVGPALADRLGVPHVSGAIDVSLRDGRVVATRPSGGRLHVLSATPPAVVSLCAAPLSRPAPAAAADASTVKIDRLGIADVGIAPGELRWRRRFAPRPRPEGATLPVAHPLRLADAPALFERLRADGFLTTRADGDGR